MKGFNTGDGYMGLVNGKYILFASESELYSQEWKYYAPVENKKYRGGRRYVPRLVEEKISEFISHFRYQ